MDRMIMGKITKPALKPEFIPGTQEIPGYFYLKPTDKLNYVTSRLIQMKGLFLEALNISEFKPINHQSVTPFYTFGLISSPTGSKIDLATPPSDVFIFNTTDGCNINVRLDLSALQAYSVFNGQIVAVKGTSTRGDTILVEEIFTTPAVRSNQERRLEISMVLCKGPFTPLSLEKLIGLQANPLVCLGPFTGTGPDEFTSFPDFIRALESEMTRMIKPKVCIVPSLDDYGSLKVFPQPAMKLSDDRISSFTNPMPFSLNRHSVLISNFDSYIDISYEEVGTGTVPGDVMFGGDRIQRLAAHLVFQQTLVPGLSSKSDVAFGPWLRIASVPDLYVITSKMKSFEKVVGPTTVVNIGGIGRRGVRIKGGEEAKYEITALDI